MDHWHYKFNIISYATFATLFVPIVIWCLFNNEPNFYQMGIYKLFLIFIINFGLQLVLAVKYLKHGKTVINTTLEHYIIHYLLFGTLISAEILIFCDIWFEPIRLLTLA